MLIPLSSPYGTPQVDDSLFTPWSDGFVQVADTPVNTVHKIEKAEFAPGVAYSAGVAGSSAAPGFVGRLDLEFGQPTAVGSGLQTPHRMVFVKTSDDDDSLRGADEGRLPQAAFKSLTDTMKVKKAVSG